MYLPWKKSAIKPVVAVFYLWDTSVIIAGGDIAQNIFKSNQIRSNQKNAIACHHLPSLSKNKNHKETKSNPHSPQNSSHTQKSNPTKPLPTTPTNKSHTHPPLNMILDKQNILPPRHKLTKPRVKNHASALTTVTNRPQTPLNAVQRPRVAEKVRSRPYHRRRAPKSPRVQPRG